MMFNRLSAYFFGNKRSVRFYKYFFSYVSLVFILLLAIGSIVNTNIITALQSEVENANVASVSQIRDSMDLRLRELQRIALQIGTNPVLTPYMLTQSGYESYLAVTELGKYRSSNSFISNILLTYNNQDNGQLYAATGVYGKNEFFNLYRFKDWNSEQLARSIETMTEPMIRPIESVYLNATTEARFATYMYPLPANSGKPYGAVLFLIDEKMLQTMTEHLLKIFNGYFYVLGPNHQLIFSDQSDDRNDGIAILKALKLEKNASPVHVSKLDGTAFTVINLPSGYNRWSYIAVIPESQFLNKVQQSRHFFLAVLIVILLLGIGLSFMLANNNYQKLRQLVLLYSEKKGIRANVEKPVDEIDFLSEAIREGTYEDGLMGKLNSKTGLIRENLLASLLKGKNMPDDDISEMKRLSGIQWVHPLFVAVLFVIDDYGEFRNRYSAAMQELFTFSIINVAEELSLEVGRGYGIDFGQERGVVLLLNLESTSSCKEKLYTFAEKIRNFFRTYYKFTLSIGIGRLYGDLHCVNMSYSEAQRALYYRFVKGNEQILFYEDVDDGICDMKYNYPGELEIQLLKSIRQGNGEEAEMLVSSIIEDIKAQALTPEKAQAACFGLLNTLLRTFDEAQGLSENKLRKELEHILTDQLQTMNEIGCRLVRICKEACDEIAQRKESKNFGLRDQILSYIHANYPNSSLTLEHIAEHFQMSPSYITRFVKDHTGYALIKYLDMLRMSRAKELLKTDDLPLSEIMKKVGYVDVSNFTRKFKKAEGITPLQYRNACRPLAERAGTETM